MANWDLGELARAAEADIREGELPMSIVAVGTDSRSLPPDSLFVALRGDRFDGHQFVDTAVGAGARAVMVDAASPWREKSAGVPRLVVQDTLRALGDVASYARRLHGKPLVAVTGSNGKTTTKELLAAVLTAGGAPVHKTHGNLNNLIGVPLTLFAWPDNAWAGVVEMGMNAPGEILRLTEIAAPTVGLITNVAAVHLEGLGTVEGVAQAKGELFTALGSDGVAVVNADDPLISSVSLAGLAEQRQLRFGASSGCDVQVVSCRNVPQGLALELRLDNQLRSFTLGLFGEHNGLNAAGALAAGLALGLDIDRMIDGLAAVEVPGGRMRVLRHVKVSSDLTVHLIDDTYNANPASMRAAFAAQASLADTARRVVVIGDMYELGDDAAALHEETGRSAARGGAMWVLSLGELAHDVARGARSAGAKADAFGDLEALWQALRAGLRGGDWVLVKGSRGMRMERVVQRLRGEGSGEAG